MTCTTDVLGSEGRPTVVFLHGAGSNRGMWATYDSTEYRGLVPDLPGHGSCADGRWSMEASVEAVVQLVRDRSPSGSAVLCGSSLGGYVAIAVAHAHPELVDGLVLSGSTASYLGWGGFETRVFGWIVKVIGPLVKRANEKALLKLSAGVGEPIVRNGMSMRAAADSLIRLPGTDYHSLLGAYKGPVLLLNGERDTVNRKEEEAVLAILANARLEIVDDSGHACVITQPVAFREAVERFVNEIQGGTGGDSG